MMVPWYYIPIALVLGTLAGAVLVCCCVVAGRADRMSEDMIRRIELGGEE